MEQEHAVFANMVGHEAELTFCGITSCVVAEILQATSPGAQTPHLPSPRRFATPSLQPDDGLHTRLHGAWGIGNSENKAGQPTPNNDKSDDMITSGSYIDTSFLGGPSKLIRPAHATPVDTYRSNDNIDVSEEPFLTQGPIDEIEANRQRQPSGPQTCPSPAVPPLRMSPISQSLETEEYELSQGVLSAAVVFLVRLGRHPLATPHAMSLLRPHPSHRPRSKLPLCIAHLAFPRLPPRGWKVPFCKASLTVTWPVAATIVA
jgi:hypothetical protein